MGWGRNNCWYPGNINIYPGNGPFNYLPPWERPGFYLRYGYVPAMFQGLQISKEDKILWLESLKSNLENAKSNIEKQLNEINNLIESLKKS
ncbi:MAG: hypothetical protein ACP5L0_07100 [Caldisphaera sp.]|uniref:hypothetical protein n=1 Tax=Caldisphaera sp. TaxID=2060322 RepID=UPI0025BB5C70|nr:hypothetical protein [Caldisphaera sp.]